MGMDIGLGMDIDQNWILAGGAGIALLLVVAWFFVRRRARVAADAESKTGERARKTPEFEPPRDAEDAANREESGETKDATEPEVVEEPEVSEEPEVGDEPGRTGAAEQAAEPGDSGEDEEAELPAEVLAAFEAARSSFVRELEGGNLSKLDIFEAYDRASRQPGAPRAPRSEYFHRVVGKAVKARDAFEALLRDEDRKKFVDVHSRYLDAVTGQEDADARAQAHRAHVEFVAGLRPAPGGES
jgi:LPXTG-motif cell wall-anchored protein